MIISELQELNDKIEKESLGIFPFIGRNIVIKLRKGFYTAKNRKYKGITAVTSDTEEYIVLLYGYYWIPENMVIYRGDVNDISTGKQAFLDAAIAQGYKFYDNLPSLKTYKFSKDSKEYQAAVKNLEIYKYG